MNTVQKMSTIRATIQEVVSRKETKLTEDMLTEITGAIIKAILEVDTNAGASNLVTLTIEPRISPKGDCKICGRKIEVGKGKDAVLTLFRTGYSEHNRPEEWVHFPCAVRAVETWIIRKEMKK